MNDSPLITQAEYARRRGVRPSAVTRAVKAGRITLIDGRLDPAVADVQWQANSRVRAGSRPAGNAPAGPPVAAAPGTDYFTSRARREAAEADLAELRRSEQRGELVRVAAVRSALAAKCIAYREAFMNMAARVAPIIAAETSQAAVQALLDAEIRAAMQPLFDVADTATGPAS